MSVAADAKKCVADPTKRIALDDLVSEQLRKVVPALEQVPDRAQGLNAKAVAEQLAAYETIVDDISTIAVVIGRWGAETQLALLGQIVAHLADASRQGGSTGVSSGLRWYPVSWLMYCAGISALSTGNYGALAALFREESRSPNLEDANAVFLQANNGVADAHSAFKLLAGLENKKLPRSEYMFQRIPR